MNKNPLVEKLLGRQAGLPLEDSVPLLEQWFEEVPGKALLECQQSVIDELLPTLFGYHLLQLSVCRPLTLFGDSKVRHKFSMSPLPGDGISALYNDEQLPLEHESVDVALIHHILDYSQNPHQMLRELQRVIIPSGHLMVVGFNPLSLLGLYSAGRRLRKSPIWQYHPLTVKRIVDWMTLMDFSVQKIEYGYYLPPVKWMINNPICKRLNNRLTRTQFPTGGFYVILAKKEVAPLTPRRQKWQKVGGIIPSIEPSLAHGQKSLNDGTEIPAAAKMKNDKNSKKNKH